MASKNAKHSKEKIEEALEAVRSKAMTLRKASKHFGIATTSLHDKMTKKSPLVSEAKRLLTNEEERRFSFWLVQMSALAFGQTVEDIKLNANAIVNQRCGQSEKNMPSRAWEYRAVYWEGRGRGQLGKVLQVFGPVWRSCATVQNAEASFRAAGIYPFSPERVLSTKRLEPSTVFRENDEGVSRQDEDDTTIDQSIDCNRRAILTGLTVGLDHAGLMKLSEGLGMPPMHEKTWRSHLIVIARQTDRIKNDILQQARDRVISYYRETEPDSFDADGVLNIGVIYDGTWAKRGFTSKLGAGAVIDTITGLVLDFHVMSSHCQLCITVEDPINIKDANAYKEWLDSHRGSCTRNHDGTAGYMEICGAVTMWGRSLNHGMRYTHFVGDGDAKTIAAAKIGLLQSFYTTAVRTYSSSTEEMSKTIWASFFHSISTSDQPKHDNCPTGADSWCFYQRALTKQPFEPSDHEQSTFMNSDVAPHVRKVYEHLTDPELLGRCLLGKTQNSNESLHSVIWAKCPKHTFSGLNRVKIGVTLAAGEFNMGSLGSHLFFPAVGCPLTSATTSLGKKRDATRIRKAEIAHQAPAKKRREVKKLAQQRAQQAAKTRALTKQPFEPSDHEQSTFLNSDVAPHVRKVYEHLTDPKLLGKTQNSNESLHSIIWAKCPKHTFCGLNRIKMSVTLAAGEFNMGSLGSHLFFPAVGCPLTSATTSLGKKRDATRIRKAEIAHQAPAKKRREVKKLAQQRAQQAATTRPLYLAAAVQSIPDWRTGVTVEIDESLVARRKNEVGRVVQQRWVFGGICRETGRGFLVLVPNKEADTLLPLVRDHIAPGSIG
ncbi:hypothetical protein EGW08_004199 [Elysia chlorotica]|uniref:Uncharacterized protein n=1 Tax=Elysia chlorotica TaxID=188477 RepID=A0A433U2I8_ELYCH|nr:hypothetical protein EGW08_004199 [Elysia chlorotica]